MVKPKKVIPFGTDFWWEAVVLLETVKAFGRQTKQDRIVVHINALNKTANKIRGNPLRRLFLMWKYRRLVPADEIDVLGHEIMLMGDDEEHVTVMQRIEKCSCSGGDNIDIAFPD